MQVAAIFSLSKMSSSNGLILSHALLVMVCVLEQALTRSASSLKRTRSTCVTAAEGNYLSQGLFIRRKVVSGRRVTFSLKPSFTKYL